MSKVEFVQGSDDDSNGNMQNHSISIDIDPTSNTNVKGMINNPSPLFKGTSFNVNQNVEQRFGHIASRNAQNEISRIDAVTRETNNKSW